MKVRTSHPWRERLTLLVVIGIGFLAMGKKCGKTDPQNNANNPNANDPEVSDAELNDPELAKHLPSDCRKKESMYGHSSEPLTAETTPHDAHTKQVAQSIIGGHPAT